MDKRVLRERMRRKKRQMMIRHYTKIGLCVIGMILAVVFVVRGIIIPIAHHVAGGGSSDQTVQAQADTEEVQANSDAAVRQPLKGKSDTDKIYEKRINEKRKCYKQKDLINYHFYLSANNTDPVHRLLLHRDIRENAVIVGYYISYRCQWNECG